MNDAIKTTARDVIKMLSSLDEVESVAKDGPSQTVRDWAPELSAEEIQNAARAYLDEVAS